jgi:hypothetical protein
MVMVVWRTVVGFIFRPSNFTWGSVLVLECLEPESCYLPACSGEIKNKWTCGLIPTKGRVEAWDKFSSTFSFMNCTA